MIVIPDNFKFPLANLAAYIANVIFVNTALLFPNAKSPAQISDMYPTLLTPAKWAFSIWGLIYALELCFIIYQFVPNVSERNVVKNGVGIWWIVASAFQVAWMFAFVYDAVWLTVVLIICIWAALMMLTLSLEKTFPSEGRTLLDFLLVQTPFAIHTGWVTLAAIVNINILLVSTMPDNYAVHIQGAVISLVVIGVWLEISGTEIPVPGFVHSAVAVWGLSAIAGKLYSDEPALDHFPHVVVEGIWLSVALLTIIALIAVLAIGSLLFFGKKIRLEPRTSEENGLLSEPAPPENVAG